MTIEKMLKLNKIQNSIIIQNFYYYNIIFNALYARYNILDQLVLHLRDA